MAPTEDAVAILRIRRGTAAEPERYDTFSLAFRPGSSILDALIGIRRETDPSLAFRYACTNANVCKECVMIIDGEAGYACTTRLRTGVITLEPLPNKPLLRDLSVDLVPPKEKP